MTENVKKFLVDFAGSAPRYSWKLCAAGALRGEGQTIGCGHATCVDPIEAVYGRPHDRRTIMTMADRLQIVLACDNIKADDLFDPEIRKELLSICKLKEATNV